VNLAFRPESGFLLPYVAAAGTLPGLSDEFMGHLAAALRERRMSVGRVLTTRRASSSLKISSVPLVLVSDWPPREKPGEFNKVTSGFLAKLRHKPHNTWVL
jgi:hypothetical protein